MATSSILTLEMCMMMMMMMALITITAQSSSSSTSASSTSGLQQEPNLRTCDKSFRYENALILPLSIDWRIKGAVTPVKNQQQPISCGSCWAFSAVAAIEGIHKLTTGELVSLSEQQLIDCDVSGISEGCTGGFVDDAFNYVIASQGLSTESSYPFTGVDNGTCKANVSDVAATILGCEDVPANDESALLKAVAHQPVSVAIDASSHAFNNYKGGIFKGPCDTNISHAVTIVGYGADEFGTKYWLVKNSWGSNNFGENGYIRMQRDVDAKEGLCGIAMYASYPVVTPWL